MMAKITIKDGESIKVAFVKRVAIHHGIKHAEFTWWSVLGLRFGGSLNFRWYKN